MSGTSLDGLDICYLEFIDVKNGYNIGKLITQAIPYSEYWLRQLKSAFTMSPGDLEKLDLEYGEYLGEKTKEFIQANNLENKTDFIASHGHTIFHEPNKGFTKQIGAGQMIANICQIKVVSDFRSLDVELGGQGAPLVPIGDKFLFGEYDGCINLGGFSNISFDKNRKRIAFDMSPCNLPLNDICKDHFNQEYDKDGELSKKGKINKELLADLNQLEYYKEQPPKSLGVEWLNSVFNPVLKSYSDEEPINVLTTISEHIAFQISNVVNANDLKRVIFTGGGVYNQFIIDKIKTQINGALIVPDNEIIEFKEALIFAFLGYLRLHNQINTLSSVTGAIRDSSGGVIHLPI